jgi:hypothetical protein
LEKHEDELGEASVLYKDFSWGICLGLLWISTSRRYHYLGLPKQVQQKLFYIFYLQLLINFWKIFKSLSSLIFSFI